MNGISGQYEQVGGGGGGGASAADVAANTSAVASLQQFQADATTYVDCPAPTYCLTQLAAKNLNGRNVKVVAVTPQATEIDVTGVFKYDTNAANSVMAVNANDNFLVHKHYVDTAATTAQTAIDQNAAAIGTNTTAIGTNAANIVTNQTNIAVNFASIGTNTTNITTNTNNITTVQSLVSTNQANIATNQTNISTNTTNITTLQNSKYDGNGFSPVPLSSCTTIIPGQTSQFYYQTTSPCTFDLSSFTFYTTGAGTGGVVHVAVYRGLLGGAGGIGTPPVQMAYGSITVPNGSWNTVVQTVSLTVPYSPRITKGENIVVGLYMGSTTLQVMAIEAQINTNVLSGYSTSDVTAMPSAIPYLNGGTYGDYRFGCHLF